VGERNGVACGSIEHKMGIKASATCVMNFDGATGYLIGPENKGLNCMFTFMNFARLGTAIQGVAHAELGFQGGLTYAKDRLAMRSLSGAKNADGPADPIIVHPDVRRMLLTSKAFAEGGRALVYFCAQLGDTVKLAKDEEERKEADALMALLTPIAKAFVTEVGLEAANHGVQIYGGHGFIREWGMEQNLRDARISTLYEGTTGIQALDLLGRKVLMTQGQALRNFTKIIHKFCEANADNDKLKELIEPLAASNKEWGDLTQAIGMQAMQNPDSAGGASVDYLMYSGYVTLAYLWALMASKAQAQLDAGAGDEDFYKAKISTARFYFKRILPRIAGHKGAIEGGIDSLMELDAEHFAF
ncbi:MAG TPA: acyl-CoA dehydrogenase, partial [Alcanivorax sp.]|nr:acyl-CoA dehydrogenase [Alcanivorax sp.]